MKYLKLIILLVIITVIGLFFVKEEPKKEEPPKENVSLTFDDEKVGYINIHNIHINEDKDYYIFTANLTNLSADKIDYNNIIIYVKDKDNNLIMTLTGYFGGCLLEEETKNVVIKTSKDLSKAKKIKFEFKG